MILWTVIGYPDDSILNSCTPLYMIMMMIVLTLTMNKRFRMDEVFNVNWHFHKRVFICFQISINNSGWCIRNLLACWCDECRAYDDVVHWHQSRRYYVLDMLHTYYVLGIRLGISARHQAQHLACTLLQAHLRSHVVGERACNGALSTAGDTACRPLS